MDKMLSSFFQLLFLVLFFIAVASSSSSSSSDGLLGNSRDTSHENENWIKDLGSEVISAAAAIRFTKWRVQEATSAYDYAYSVAVSPDGASVYVTGGTEGSLYATNKGGGDIILERRDAVTGALIWGLQYGTNSSEISYSVAVSPDGASVYVTGGTEGSLYASNRGGDDIFLERRDAATGTLIWGLQYGTNSSDSAHSVAVSPDGASVFVTGDTGGSLYNTSKGKCDIFLEKRDAVTGALIWGLQYGTIQNDYARSVAVSPNGASVYVTGGTEGILYVTRIGNSDIILERRDAATGDLVKGLQYGSYDYEYGEYVSVQSGGSMLLVKGFSSDLLFPPWSGNKFEATHDASTLTLLSGNLFTLTEGEGSISSATVSGVKYDFGNIYDDTGVTDYWVSKDRADGTHYFQTSSSCTACPVNTVSPTADNSACTCSASYYNPTAGSGTHSDPCLYCSQPSADNTACLAPTGEPTALPTSTSTPTRLPTLTPTSEPTAEFKAFGSKDLNQNRVIIISVVTSLSILVLACACFYFLFRGGCGANKKHVPSSTEKQKDVELGDIYKDPQQSKICNPKCRQ